jgi:Flp pilus assembly protein TadG
MLDIRQVGREAVANARGNVAILFALCLPVIVGGAGFGVETTYWYYKRLALQAAADAAAYSAALEKRSGGNTTEVRAVVDHEITDNGFNPAVITVQVNPATVSGGGSVQVILTDSAKRFFTGMFISQDPVFTARATATYNSAASACILALSPTANKAADFSGSSSVTLDGCSVMSNSNKSDAVNIWGSSLLTTTCVIAVGGVANSGGLTMSQCTTPVTNAPSVADPFSDVPAPTPSGACLNQNANNETISPGRYCSGLSLKNNVTMNPGVYYIESSSGFDVNANANVIGTGVTIYLSGSAHVSINGNATVNLQAPTSGTYSGVLFFGDRASTGLNKFNGTAASKLTGAIYFANQDIQYNGNFSGLNGCTQVVGSTIAWTGNTTVAVDCTAYGMRTLPVLTVVRLTA